MKRIAFAFLIALAPAAEAQQWRSLPMICGSHQWLDSYIGRYSEDLLHAGSVKGGRTVEFWVNQSTGTFTSVIRDKTFACVMADGNEFNPNPDSTEGEPS